MTFDSEQSRTLLGGDGAAPYIRDTPPRDWRAVIANARVARRLLARMDLEQRRAPSNGAGIALSFLPIAAARGIPAHYIEWQHAPQDRL